MEQQPEDMTIGFGEYELMRLSCSQTYNFIDDTFVSVEVKGEAGVAVIVNPLVRYRSF